MTLVGKIFTVLIFIMSLVFMSFAVMVFATHRNWKEIATNPDPGPGKKLGLQQQLEQAKLKRTELENQLAVTQNDLKEEQASRRMALAALQVRLARSEEALGLKQGELDTLNANHTKVAEGLSLAEERLKALETETQALRVTLRDTQHATDKTFDTVVTLTDQLNQAEGLKLRLGEKNTQLAQEVTRMKMVMDANGLTVNTLVSHIAPKVEGRVLAVGDKDLVEISIGSDDGLKEGHALEVYRGNTYLGRIIIRRTAPDRAVGQIVRELQRGQIKQGDNVSSKLS
jgi:uncharacterized protein YlxW (UPF0749 family)